MIFFKHAAWECTFCNNPKIESLWIFLHGTRWLWNTTFDFHILTLHSFTSFSLYSSFTYFLFTSFRKLFSLDFVAFNYFCSTGGKFRLSISTTWKIQFTCKWKIKFLAILTLSSSNYCLLFKLTIHFLF